MNFSKYALIDKIIKDPVILLRVGLGIVFVLAGLHRILFFNLAYANFVDLSLKPPSTLVILTIIIELVAGVLLIINKFVAEACVFIILLLLGGITSAIIRAGYSLVQKINEIFLITYTPTDIVLHISYLVGIITILLFSLKRNDRKK